MARRINRELKLLMKDNNIEKNGFQVEQVANSTVNLLGKIKGAQDSVYQGGVFKVEIKIPDNYPFNPPKCKMLTKVWHPNISSATGAICLDVLKDNWSAAFSVSSILLSIQSLLTNPEPNDPQDAVVANMLMKNKELFSKTAKYWTKLFAIDEEEEEKVRKEIQMNEKEEESQESIFDEFEELVNKVMTEANIIKEKAVSELSCHSWDLNKVLHSLGVASFSAH